ncbi:MAG: D-alanyl-D-alanine carboxypeptidase family protein [Gammaproteobacteria bacterium]
MSLHTPSHSFTARLFLILAMLLPPLGASAAGPIPTPPELGARSYILLDFATGQVLAEQNADEPVEPASLTKLMTAYLVFEELSTGNLKLDDTLTVSERAWRMKGSRMFIEVNKQVRVDELLQGMIVQSGNDASVALAEMLAGTEETFANMMNRKAKELGMKNTHFMNSTGMPADNHMSTARDIALLSTALIREFPQYYAWYSQKEFEYNDINQMNRNKLLWRDDSVDGLKTGYTKAAGYCLASSALRDGMRLVSVVMGTKSSKARIAASQALLNYGFRFFGTHRLYGANESITNSRVWKGTAESLRLGLGRDMWITIPKGSYDDLDATVEMQPTIVAPISKGQVLGRVTVKLGDKVLAEQPLLSLDDVPEGNLWNRMRDGALLWLE